MFPKMISDFYSTKVPPPPEHLVRKIVPASSESSTSAYPQRQQPICRRCKGQLISECLFDILNFPKKQWKI